MIVHAQILQAPKWRKEKRGAWHYVTDEIAAFALVGCGVADCDIFHGDRMIGFVRNEILTILHQYAWNGMTYYRDKKDNMMDSLLHDFLYQTGLVSRLMADLILWGMSRVHDRMHLLILAAVRCGGHWFYAKDGAIRIVRVMPHRDNCA